MAFKLTQVDKEAALASVAAVLGAAFGNKIPVVGKSKLIQTASGIVLVALGIYLDGAYLGPAVMGLGIGIALGAWL
jgi:hypothetical protein